MKLKLLITLMLMTSVFALNAQSSYEEQLRLRFDDRYINHIKANKPQLYNIYISEFKSSYEFVTLKPNRKYPELQGYDYRTKQEKNVEFISLEKFSLYNYRFKRHLSLDIVYRIPGTNQGILIYSKQKFDSKL